VEQKIDEREETTEERPEKTDARGEWRGQAQDSGEKREERSA
jgi:hypothetical protein